MLIVVIQQFCWILKIANFKEKKLGFFFKILWGLEPSIPQILDIEMNNFFQIFGKKDHVPKDWNGSGHK